MGIAQDVEELQLKVAKLIKAQIQERAALELLCIWLDRHTIKSADSERLLRRLRDPNWDGS